MDAMGGVSLHPSEKFSGRGAIQTPFDEYNVGANLPQVAPQLICQCAITRSVLRLSTTSHAVSRAWCGANAGPPSRKQLPSSKPLREPGSRGRVCGLAARRPHRGWQLPGVPCAARDEQAGGIVCAGGREGAVQDAQARREGGARRARRARRPPGAAPARPRRLPARAAGMSAAAAPTLAVLHGCYSGAVVLCVAPLAAAGSMLSRMAPLLLGVFCSAPT
jgi:hypothetical protein